MIRKLWLRWLNRHDDAVRTTPLVQKFSGYDEDKAFAGAARARRVSKHGRKLPRPKTARPAEVVGIETKRRAR